MGQQLDGSFVGDDVLLGDAEADHDNERSHFHAFFSAGQTTGLLFPLRGNRVRVFAQLPPGVDPARPVSTSNTVRFPSTGRVESSSPATPPTSIVRPAPSA
jgi:hypothetical protein